MKGTTKTSGSNKRLPKVFFGVLDFEKVYQKRSMESIDSFHIPDINKRSPERCR